MDTSTRSIYSSTHTGTTVIGGGGGTVPAVGGGTNLAPDVPADITFDLTPGQTNSAFPIYYTSTTGIKLFNSAILKFLEIFGRESKSVNMLNEKL